MNENQYRLFKAVSISATLISMLILGGRFLSIADQFAQNGRYIQYDMQKTFSPDSRTRMSVPEYKLIDTRTGKEVIP